MADSIAPFYFCAINLFLRLTKHPVINHEPDQLIINHVRRGNLTMIYVGLPGEPNAGNEAGPDKSCPYRFAEHARWDEHGTSYAKKKANINDAIPSLQ